MNPYKPGPGQKHTPEVRRLAMVWQEGYEAGHEESDFAKLEKYALVKASEYAEMLALKLLGGRITHDVFVAELTAAIHERDTDVVQAMMKSVLR